MKKTYLLLVGIILLYSGCTKNNQNTPATFAYLNVNETFIGANNDFKAYDIDNDGTPDCTFGIDLNSVDAGNTAQLSYRPELIGQRIKPWWKVL